MTCVGWPGCREESCAVSAWKRVQRCKEVQIVAITCKIVSCPANGLTSRQSAGNLSAAGRQLGLSLTSVSRQLMALEEVLGTTLVERTTRHLSLMSTRPVADSRDISVRSDTAGRNRSAEPHFKAWSTIISD
jgi:hypothetical protein